MAPTSRFAWATLLTKNEYLPGVLVLHAGLRKVKSKYPLVVMAPPKLPEEARYILKQRGIVVRDIDFLEKKDSGATDKRFADAWTKIRVWELLEYDRVILIDSDVLVRRNMDELLENIEVETGHIAAAHVCACNPKKFPHYPKYWVPENCAHTAVGSPSSPPPVITPSSPRPYGQLNSGLVVLRPSKETFEELHNNLDIPDSRNWVFADQDLITEVFQGKWKPLPWYYNALKTVERIHPQIWDDEEIRCLHYILGDKPWQSRLMVRDQVFGKMNQWWWDAWDEVIEELEGIDARTAGFVSQFVDYNREYHP